MPSFKRFLHTAKDSFFRRKPITEAAEHTFDENNEKLLPSDAESQTTNKLTRSLGGFDLVLLGIGSTLGAGVYISTGQIAAAVGPSVIFCFFIAAAASMLAGFSYAEFASRVPKAGSVYLFSYVTIGEMVAWIMGWDLILEYIIGTAAVARSWSAYFDNLTGGAMSQAMNDSFFGSWRIDGVFSVPDPFAFMLILILSFIVCLGVKESALFNNICTFVNLFVILFITVVGCFYIDVSNWTDVPFFAADSTTFIANVATCFFAYIGFDVIATSAEEVKKPGKDIPVGIIGSLTGCLLSYMSVSTIISLIVPFTLLSTEAAQSAPLSAAFDLRGVGWARHIINIGALVGMSTSLLAALFPLPRIIYSLARDGLLPPFFSQINQRFRTPINGMLLAGSFAGLLALLFDVNALASMMSVGTIIAYTTVSASVLILRYRDATTPAVSAKCTSAVVVFILSAITFSLSYHYGQRYFSDEAYYAIVSILGAETLLPVVYLFYIRRTSAFDHTVAATLKYACPWVPAVPLLAIGANMFFIVTLDYMHWVRVGGWLVVGLVIYLSYGMWNSLERNKRLKESLLKNDSYVYADVVSYHVAA
eukprot:GILK01013619.1.p1 GENE.GILK01013619.1~~GILK01013619.1.p1  ORF type:complete len:591 (+),score=76.42 GILK01013619.1:200-1972(+)